VVVKARMTFPLAKPVDMQVTASHENRQIMLSSEPRTLDLEGYKIRYDSTGCVICSDLFFLLFYHE